MAEPAKLQNGDSVEMENETAGKSSKGVSVATLTGQLMTNPDVMAAFEKKLGSMVGKSSGYVDSLPACVKRRLKALKKLQAEFLQIESKFYKEVHELECKYLKLYTPLYEKRQAIVNADVEPTDAECEFSEDDDSDDETSETTKVTEVDETKQTEKAVTDSKTMPDDAKGVPEFWLTIFKNVDILAAMVQEYDEPVLRHLQDIRVKYLPADNMGFELQFVFSENEFFTNTVLTKLYTMRCEPDAEHPLTFEGPSIVKCSGCRIDWKAGKNVTVKLVKQTKKHKGHGAKKAVTKSVKQPSFFDFFSPPQVEEDDEMGEEDEELLSTDFEVGQTLQERIIPRAVLYFTGEAVQDDDDDDDEEGEEEGGEEEYNEDEDADYVPPKGSENKPADCKQQ